MTEVRGIGLMIGVEFTSHAIAEAVAQLCFRRGLLVLECGQKAIRISPPLILTDGQADTIAEVFARAVADAAACGRPRMSDLTKQQAARVFYTWTAQAAATPLEIVGGQGARFVTADGAALVGPGQHDVERAAGARPPAHEGGAGRGRRARAC